MVYDSLEQHEEYNRYIDNLGIDEVRNILLVPVYAGRNAVGCIAAANGCFTDAVVKVCKFLGLIIQAVFKSESTEFEHSGRRLKILLHWCKQVFLVTVTSQSKLELVKELSYSIETNI
jgi:hypothetical protein